MKHRLDLVYSLVMAIDLKTAARELLSAAPSTPPEIERHASLAAELRLKCGDVAGALTAIDDALVLVPDSSVLVRNRESLAAR